MKTVVVLLLTVAIVATAVHGAHHEVHAEQNYCPRNERKSCKTPSENREKFDFLLSCPASAPLYKLRGSYQGDNQFNPTQNSAWHSSYLFTQNADLLTTAVGMRNQGLSASPNMYGVLRADRDVFLFESAFENGVVDERQGACRSWHHQFAANKDVFVFGSGSGNPIIVAQDRRWGSRRWGQSVQEMNRLSSSLQHDPCLGSGCDYAADDLEAQRAKLINGIWDQWHEGRNSDSSYKYTGQWLYSVCTDAECSGASTPRPFWGRDIGSPLHQNTLAELAFFPMAPDWAYNSPVLGGTPTEVVFPNTQDGNGQSSSGAFIAGLQNKWAVGNSPGGIASTYVTNDNGDELLVLMVSGLPIANGGDASPSSSINLQPLGEWYLVWCQDVACSTWGVKGIEATTYNHVNEQLPAVRSASGWANLRPSLATDTDGQTVHWMLHSRSDSRQILVGAEEFASIAIDDDSSNTDKLNRLSAMDYIYANLIGVPTGPSADYKVQNGWMHSGPQLSPLEGAGARGNAWDDAAHPLLTGPLRHGYAGSRQVFDNQSPYDARHVCTGLENYGIKSDPFCHWTSYFETISSASKTISVAQSEVLDMGYDVVVPCEGTPYYFYSRRAPGQHSSTEGGNAAVAWTDGTNTWYWPKSIEDPDDLVDNEAIVNMSPYQMADIVFGRRFSAVRSANSQPFFTWADLGAGLSDGAVQTWGVCGFEGSPASVDPSCHTVLDSIELGTMGWLNGFAGKTLLLSAPDDELPVMVYYFDHFGGSGSFVEFGVDGLPNLSPSSIRASATGVTNPYIAQAPISAPSAPGPSAPAPSGPSRSRLPGGYGSDSLFGPANSVFGSTSGAASIGSEFSDMSSRLRVPSPGQVTNRPLVIACLDALCEEASLSAFAPARMADVVNWWQGPYMTAEDLYAHVGFRTSDGTDRWCVDWAGRPVDCDSSADFGRVVAGVPPLKSSHAPGNVDTLNLAEYPLFSLRQVNPAIRADARFVGDQLYVVLNEGGYDDEFANNPVKVWRTNRWASPTGMPCSGGNVGQRVVADDVVYICTRARIGNPDAKLYAGSSPRPWTRLYEWVKMDWGFGLRTLGGFLGWGSDEQTLLDIVSDKNPFFTHGTVDWLEHAQYSPMEFNNFQENPTSYINPLANQLDEQLVEAESSS